MSIVADLGFDRRPEIGTKEFRAYRRVVYDRYYVKTGIRLPRDTEADYEPYKEPLEPVREGFGYYGTVAHNKAGTHVQCHLCGYFFRGLTNHLKRVHEITASEYKHQFQLARQTGLISHEASLRAAQAAMARPAEQKKELLEKRLKNLEAGRTTRDFDISIKKSLEAKNKEGRCYYQLLDKITILTKALGRTPTRRDFEKLYGGGYLGSVYNTFGSWNEALTIAGLQPNRIGNRNAIYNRDDVIALIKEFYKIEGRVPRAKDMGGGVIPSKNVIQRLFGGIIEARKAAGFVYADFINEAQL